MMSSSGGLDGLLLFLGCVGLLVAIVWGPRIVRRVKSKKREPEGDGIMEMQGTELYNKIVNTWALFELGKKIQSKKRDEGC